MSIEELLREHRRVARVAQRWGDEAMHLWYADLGVEVDGDQISYSCPRCGESQASTIHEFIYVETSAHLICGSCRGDVEERAGALD